MEQIDEDGYRLLKTVYDVIRLRNNVSKMSFIAQSLCWLPIPVIVRED